MRLVRSKVLDVLNETQKKADKHSMCSKVAVGSCIITDTGVQVFGSNETLPKNCKLEGCLREELYGERSKEHRLPSDCRAIHSEIDAICACASHGLRTEKSAIVVTRYPCEACARAIVTAKIDSIYYGREQEISEETKKIFDSAGVHVEWIKEWTYEDTEE